MIAQESEVTDGFMFSDVLAEYITEEDLAANLNVHRRTLRNYGLPRLKVGRRTFYRRSAVAEGLRKRERQQNARRK